MQDKGTIPSILMRWETTHVAAHKGKYREVPSKSKGRTTPKNHYQVNLEIFIEHFGEEVEEDDSEGSIYGKAEHNPVRQFTEMSSAS